MEHANRRCRHLAYESYLLRSGGADLYSDAATSTANTHCMMANWAFSLEDTKETDYVQRQNHKKIIMS